MMKKAVLLYCVLLSTTVTPFVGDRIWGGNSMVITKAVAGSNPGGVLGVDRLIKEVDRHKGLIRVEGIVTAVVPDIAIAKSFVRLRE